MPASVTADSGLLNPGVEADAGRLRQAFATARPFRNVVIDDFLGEAFLQRLLTEFPAFDERRAIGDDGRPGGKATVPGVRRLGPAFCELDDLVRSPRFLDLVSTITGIPDLIYDPFYLGGGTHENRDGQALDPHVDFNYHPSERWHRRLNLIMYLNETWAPEWGGTLELFGDPRAGAAERSVLPLLNRCVLFETTEHSWHGFERIQLPGDRKHLTRKSIALYFYSRSRPQDETAPKHTTIYHQKGLPEWCAPGAELDAQRIAELQALIERRDAHIDLLYGENARLLQAQEKGLLGGLLYLLKRAYVRARR